MKVAIFGGSFNPPTKGHEAIARACLNVPDIDEVWVMPSGDRLDKTYTVSDAERLAMVALMAESIGDTKLRVSRFELDLERPTKTIKTLGALSMEYPEVEPYYVLGADSYWSMPTDAWVEGNYLQKNLQMLIVPRAGYQLPLSQNVTILPVTSDILHISSSEVRNKALVGESLADLVPSTIEAYIEEHALYTDSKMEVAKS